MTGTATLSVIVKDINDNAPVFAEDYQPQIPEDEDITGIKIVQTIFAKDADAFPYADPFGFRLDCPTSPTTGCEKFANLFEVDNGKSVIVGIGNCWVKFLIDAFCLGHMCDLCLLIQSQAQLTER